jgi:hypothetical protein
MQVLIQHHSHFSRGEEKNLNISARLFANVDMIRQAESGILPVCYLMDFPTSNPHYVRFESMQWPFSMRMCLIGEIQHVQRLTLGMED